MLEVVGVDPLEPAGVGLDEGVRVVAEHGRVLGGNDRLAGDQVEVVEPLTGGLERQAQALFALAEALLFEAALGQVAGDGREVAERAVGLIVGHNHLPGGDIAAVAIAKDGLALPEAIGDGAGDGLVQDAPGDIGGVIVADQRLFDAGLLGDAEQLPPGLVHEGDPPGRVG